MLASRLEDRGSVSKDPTEDKELHPAVYILASRRRGTLYISVNSGLWSRVCDHKNGVHDGFTKEHGVQTLVWYAHYPTVNEEIHREKQMKAWKMERKTKVIKEMNPGWKDLRDSIDAIATLMSPKRDPSMRWGDGKTVRGT
jgi:putative endonuclease